MITTTIGSLKKKSSSPRVILGSVMTGLSGLCMVLTLIPLIAVLYFVIIQGFSRLNVDLFTQLPPPPGLDEGGLANAIIGTLAVVGIAAILAVPIGVLAAVYLSEFSNGNKFATSIRFATNVLSGVPSIIAGIFAYGLLVSSGIVGFSAIAGGVSLAVLMLPTIIRTTDEALKIVPQEIRWAALGVGAYNYQTVLKIVLPAALPGIITGVTLAIARAAGETAPLIFTALFSNFWPNISPQGLLEPIATLSVLVYNFAILPFPPQQELAWAGSLILVFLVLGTSIIARLATRRKIY
ncbi:phosphate ABC transporter permease PstA [Geminocystis sp. NIES-3709]|uniref:phosphate ABC transporter permease PstA n=1 Tax=Geminocystis sp. NIES-3709 TaxID=1617448 RepID=UPI0005FC9D8F|nr:phosphate ABC transporter permease PstA [Geminocystis sp. NIES-3709]BAQ63696.1 phosphate transport system permease protein PstA [Geminocystis sp. NIES-3709]